MNRKQHAALAAVLSLALTTTEIAAASQKSTIAAALSNVQQSNQAAIAATTTANEQAKAAIPESAKSSLPQYKTSDKVRVQVDCGGKTPIIVTTSVVSVDESGNPAVDRSDVSKKAGGNCSVGSSLKIEQTEAQKEAVKAAQKKAWLKKGQALIAMVVQAKGNSGAAQALTGLLGVTSMLDANASEADKTLAMKALAGSLVGGEATSAALAEYVKAKTVTIDTFAAVVDQQQEMELKAALKKAEALETIVEKPKTETETKQAAKAVSSGKTNATSKDSYAASVKYPASAKAYDGLIESAAATYGVDPDILRAMATVESNFNPNAVSSVGARGLVQIMPKTAEGLGYSAAQMFNPKDNLMAAAKYVSQLQKKSYIGNNLSLISAAYNAGPGNVAKYKGVPPFTETQNHVRKVNAVYYALKARKNQSS